MRGRIRVGTWLCFDAAQTFHGHAFVWDARAGIGPIRPLHVVDRYADGYGRTDGTVFGRRFLRAEGSDVARAAAGRAAAESIWLPELLRHAAWTQAGPDSITADLEVPPETARLTLTLDQHGGVTSVSLPRWGNVGRQDYGYIPFGGEVHAERRFGDVVVPSRLSVGWWYGTPRYRPFFEAEITAMRSIA